jgi:hypothetical protein
MARPAEGTHIRHFSNHVVTAFKANPLPHLFKVLNLAVHSESNIESIGDRFCWGYGLLLSAYTLSTSCLNQSGRKMTTNNPIELVIGNIGINMKVKRTRPHLILATMEAAIIILFLT